MLDLNAPDGWLTAEEWFSIGAVSMDTATRIHLLDFKRGLMPDDVYQNALAALEGAVLQELEDNYGVPFEADQGRFRRTE